MVPRFAELFAVRAGNVTLDAYGSVAVHFADRFPGWSSFAVHFPDLLEDYGLRFLNVPFSFLWPWPYSCSLVLQSSLALFSAC